MSDPTSIAELDLNPIPGKKYWNCDREWREEFIYFLLVDRFHDDHNRTPINTPNTSQGKGSLTQLKKFYGGTIKGIKNHLDYIQNLGGTAIWISPIFENTDAPDPNGGSYHGYSIQNYLAIDPRFGTKQDLIDLVDAAHKLEMRVFLDVVINHSGDNWYYKDEDKPGVQPYQFFNDTQFEFGGWRRPDRPIPQELRNPNYYHRRGRIRNWDSYPEYQHGDFESLKDFNNDDDANGLKLQETLIKAHCYWMREADVDGFRMDAVKHFSPLAVSRFCSTIREYAYRLGKRWFFLFGELIAGDDTVDRYIGQNTPTQMGDQTIFFGLSSVLDFPLYWTVGSVLKGLSAPGNLIGRYEALRNLALSRGELGRYRVTFLDNHDQVGPNPKRRFGTDAPAEQVIAGVGYLLCALGTACIYYGTEQGFSGHGDDDALIREAMFDRDNPSLNLLNQNCTIYREIAKIAQVQKKVEALRFGRMYFREISGNGREFELPPGSSLYPSFSRLLGFQEVLVAYNTSTTVSRQDYVIVDSGLHKAGDQLTFVYGGKERLPFKAIPDLGNPSVFVQLDLQPMQFVILQ